MGGSNPPGVRYLLLREFRLGLGTDRAHPPCAGDRAVTAVDHPGGARSLVSRIDRTAASVRPQLFGYQFIYELSPT